MVLGTMHHRRHQAKSESKSCARSLRMQSCTEQSCLRSQCPVHIGPLQDGSSWLSGKAGLRHGDWKLVRMGGRKAPGKARWELYNLSKDLSEQTDLAESHPERVAELLNLWQKMNSDMSEPAF